MAGISHVKHVSFLGALALAVVLACGANAARAQEGGAPALSAEQLVVRMAQASLAIKTYEATGRTRLEQKAAEEGRTIELPFQLKVRRPDGLYFKTEQPDYGFLATWEGRTGWLHAFHENQYQKHEGLEGTVAFVDAVISTTDVAGFPLIYARDLLTADPNSGLLARTERMEIARGDLPQTYLLTLHQREGDVVRMTVGEDDFMLRRALFDLTPVIRKRAAEQRSPVPDDLLVTITVTFDEPKVDQAIDEQAFRFTPPEGAVLVEKFGLQPLTGKPAPDFTLTSLSREEITLSALRGKVVLLDFWDSRCEPCRVAMPYLEKLHQEFGEKGLVILGVNNEERASVERFIREQKVTFTILLDRDGSTGATYDVRAIPRTLIIDSQGTVYADFMGLQPEERLRAALAQLDIK